jgi:hypothetical protein
MTDQTIVDILVASAVALIFIGWIGIEIYRRKKGP